MWCGVKTSRFMARSSSAIQGISAGQEAVQLGEDTLAASKDLADLADYLQTHGLLHTRRQPFYPMTQGKIERYHRSRKNIICLENYYFPWQLEQAVAAFVDYYKNRRYHEALGNVTSVDVYFGRATQFQTRREAIKQKALTQRPARKFVGGFVCLTSEGIVEISVSSQKPFRVSKLPTTYTRPRMIIDLPPGYMGRLYCSSC